MCNHLFQICKNLFEKIFVNLSSCNYRLVFSTGTDQRASSVLVANSVFGSNVGRESRFDKVPLSNFT